MPSIGGKKSFAPGQLIDVEVRFELVGDGMRITIEHRGWNTVPPEHVARHGFPNDIFLRRHAEWWQMLLSSYRLTLG